MKIIKLKDTKQKFANARELCPGMSDEIYAITDYISTVANDCVPIGLVMTITLILDDLKKERNRFKCNEPLPNYLIDKKNQIVTQMEYIPQVVDAIADEDFALEFRKICKEILGIDPPKRVVDAQVESEYPEYALVAAEWWINQIQSPKFDNGMDIPAFLLMGLTSGTKKYTEDEIKKFKEGLAKEILYKVQNYGCCYLSVDYSPCETFSQIEDETDVKITSYPWKTSMDISGEEIVVYQSGDKKIIWEQKNNELKQKK